MPIDDMNDDDIQDMVFHNMEIYEKYYLPKGAISDEAIQELRRDFNVHEERVSESPDDEEHFIEGIHDESEQVPWTMQWHYVFTKKSDDNKNT